jgi:hypothetical protein
VLIGNEGDFVVQDFRNLSQFQKWYGFVAASTTAVARNWFLDATTPYGPSGINARNRYGMWQWGVAAPLPWGGKASGSRIVYSQSARTREFDSNRLASTSGTQRWATITLVADLN